MLRLYVASMDYADDVGISERGIKEMSEAYRKIRNTFRYLLGNLGGLRAVRPAHGALPTRLHEIDRWALGQLNQVIRDVRDGVRAVRVLPRLPADLPVLRGRAVELLPRRAQGPALRRAPDGPDRRAAQFVLARLHDDLTRLLAPIIPHTAEESWDYLPARRAKPPSVHLAEFPEPDPDGTTRPAMPGGTPCSNSARRF